MLISVSDIDYKRIMNMAKIKRHGFLLMELLVSLVCIQLITLAFITWHNRIFQSYQHLVSIAQTLQSANTIIEEIAHQNTKNLPMRNEFEINVKSLDGMVTGDTPCVEAGKLCRLVRVASKKHPLVHLERII